MDIDSVLNLLKALAEPHGLTVLQRDDPGHFQILNGARLVNYYPSSKNRTAYIQGMAGSHKHVTPEQVINLALRPAPIIRSKVGRRRSGKRYRKIKERLYARSNLCYRCGKVIENISEVTIDHIIPRSKGGLDHPNNYAISHGACNWRAGNDMPERKEHG